VKEEGGRRKEDNLFQDTSGDINAEIEHLKVT